MGWSAGAPRGRAWFLGVLLTAAALGADARGLYLDRLDSPGPQPEGMASDGEHLWVGDFLTGLIYRLDPAHPESVTAFSSPGTSVEGLAWDGTHLWSDDWDTRLIYRLEVTDTALVVTRSFPSPDGTTAVGLTWDGESLWLTTWYPMWLYRLDPETGAVLFSRKIQAAEGQLYPTVGLAVFPEDLAWDGEALWITDWYTGQVYRIHPETMELLATHDAGGSRTVGLAFHQGYLWNGDTENPSPSLFRLDITESTPVRRTTWGALKRWVDGESPP